MEETMKVENMTSARGNKIANQFIIEGEHGEYFQPYNTIIAFKPSGYFTHSKENLNKCIELDRDKWDYSVTTSKYRNIFLGETKKETQAKIDSGEYKLVDLN